MANTSRRPAAEAGIVVEPNPNRIVVRLGGQVIADSSRALIMRATNSAPTHYIPREDVDMSRLHRTPHATHCPYKGDASYWSIRAADRTADNAVWSYETPYDDVKAIEGHLAFYPDRVDAIEELPLGPQR
jgi:uncharacterized protein (DUF427 family)